MKTKRSMRVLLALLLVFALVIGPVSPVLANNWSIDQGESVEITPDQTVEETSEETPAETVEETPAESVEESTEETVAETAEETVAETAEETTEESVEETVAETVEETGQVVTIVHTNDIHGRTLGGVGFPRLKTIVDTFKANGPTIVLDAGDAVHGTSFASFSKGQSMINLLDSVGYNAITPGNHEFNYGYARLKELANSANFPFLAANIKDANGNPVFGSHSLIQAGDKTIGIFGIATPETKTKSDPRNTEGLTFEDVVATAQNEVNALRAAGVDAVVFLSHLGTDSASPINSYTVLDSVTGIDAVIDGHSHTVFDGGTTHNGTFLTSTGSYLNNVGVTRLTFNEDGTVTPSSELISPEEAAEYAEDAAIKAQIEGIQAEIDEQKKVIIGETAVTLTDSHEDGTRAVRQKETNLTKLIVDAIQETTGADVTLVNGGGIREEITAGQITLGDAETVLPFGNLVTVIKVTGQDIIDALNFGVDAYPKEKGSFPQVAGVTFELVEGSPSHVQNIKVGGSPIIPSATYTLATNDFMAVGGDGYTMFTGKEQVNLYGMMLDIFVEKIVELSQEGPFTYDREDNITLAQEEARDYITLIHTNDVHGRVSTADGLGLDKVKTIVDEFRSQGSVLLVDAGDATHGTTFVMPSEGKAMVDLMNMLGYQALVPGNHEFNYGRDGLNELADLANFDILASNIINESGNPEFSTAKVYQVGDKKVGVFGLATPETKEKSHPNNTVGLDFTDVVESAKSEVSYLKGQDVDAIVLLSHLGYDLTPINIRVVLDQVTDIDLVVDGHSHHTFPTGEVYNGTKIVSTGNYLANLGVVRLYFNEDGTIDTDASLIPASYKDKVASDQEVLDYINTVYEENAAVFEQVIGSTTTDLQFYNEEGVRIIRNHETNLGNLVTDAMLVGSGADVVLTNGGGIRAHIPAGDITLNQAISVLPFGNTVTVIKVTGQDILDALRFGARLYPAENGGFPHVAGMTYEILVDEDGKYADVVNVRVAGQPLDLDREYRLATNDFMAAGGDGYTMFAGKESTGVYPLMLDMFIEYIVDLSADGPFTYTTDGRIKAVTEVVAPEEPIDEKPAPIAISQSAKLWMRYSDADIEFKSNGEFESLVRVLLDGELFIADAKSGSTIVTLKASDLQTLEAGKHTLTMVFAEGESHTEGQVHFEFEVVDIKDTEPGQKPGQPTDGKSPTTGDVSLVATAMFAALASGGYIIASKKKKETK